MQPLSLLVTLKIDFYFLSLVLLVPENGSDELRHLIQALLIAYAEPKLNVINHPTVKSRLASYPNDPCWCQQLVHPRLYSSV